MPSGIGFTALLRKAFLRTCSANVLDAVLYLPDLSANVRNAIVYIVKLHRLYLKLSNTPLKACITREMRYSMQR